MAIIVNNVNVDYESILVLDNLNFNIPRKLMTAIVGPNGAGKSTLLKATLGLTDYTGKISFFGETLLQARKKIAYMSQFQEVDWFFPMTVFDVVLMGRAPFKKFWQRYNLEDFKLVESALKDIGMLNFRDSHISKLSGGQKQKVFLARCIVQNPEILFLDEPLAGIDFKSMREIFEILQKLKSQGKSIVMIHHDLSNLEEYFDYLVVVNKQIIDYGPTVEVLARNSIEMAFNKVS